MIFHVYQATNVWACIDVKLTAYVEPYYSEHRKLTKRCPIKKRE